MINIVDQIRRFLSIKLNYFGLPHASGFSRNRKDGFFDGPTPNYNLTIIFDRVPPIVSTLSKAYQNPILKVNPKPPDRPHVPIAGFAR